MSRYSKVIAIGLMLMSIDCHAYITHEVKRGETLWGLSHKYNVKPNDITKLNPEADRGLKIGMKLRIPENEAELNGVVPQPTETSIPEKSDPKPHEAQLETITSTIKEMPSVTSVEIVDANDTPQSYNALENPMVSVADNLPYYDNHEEVYSARFGDTLSGISAKTGVPENDLIKFNPLLDPEHISEGTVVRLTSSAPYIVNATNLSVVDSIVYRVRPAVAENPVLNTNTVRTIAVMLPFDVENETISRQSLLATEFYKGFMLATQKATENRDTPLRIIAIDTQCDSIQFDMRLRQLASQNVSIIIPPDDERQLEKIEDFALDNNIVVLNVLNIKDEGYMNRPNVIQCNISQKLMYDKAIKALMEDFEEYTPVILDLAGGKDEKLSFVEELRQQYDAAGKKVINLSFKNKLEESVIKTLDSNKKYIFIPKSGSSDVFNKISETLTLVINENILDDQYKVFGYPDWITFRGEQEEALHTMGANIYSRFYFDSNDFHTEDANKEFIKWYGTGMEEVFPAQGLLGYDAGTLLYSALRKKFEDDDLSRFRSGSYEGIQSAFKFTNDNAGDNAAGLMNETLYIIEYLPGQVLYVKTI